MNQLNLLTKRLQLLWEWRLLHDIYDKNLLLWEIKLTELTNTITPYQVLQHTCGKSATFLYVYFSPKYRKTLRRCEDRVAKLEDELLELKKNICSETRQLFWNGD